MKKAVLLTVLLAAAVAEATPTVGKVLVRQNWPWSNEIKIDYQLMGATATTPADVDLKFYEGTTEIAASLHNAVVGDRYGMTTGGAKTLTIDAAKAFGSRKVKMENFRVVVTASASQVAKLDEELYRIYDLTSSTKPIPYESVTRKKLLNGEYGTYEVDYAKIGAGFSSPLDDVLIWTGVTNDIAYKTTKLVMRHIYAKNVTWTMGSPTTEFGRTANRELQRQVILTNDYLIGVFEMTRAQYARYHNEPPVEDAETNGDVAMDGAGFAYEIISLQGWWVPDNYAADKQMYNWPTNIPRRIVRNNRIIGKMQSQTGIKFHLPTQAQWEYACRAGATSGLYNGKELTTKDEADPNLESIAWTEFSGIDAVQRVGQKAPNAWGLYDMLGNASEWCLDWANPNMDVAYTFDYGTRTTFTHDEPVVDPVGPGDSSESKTESNAYYRSRTVRGGNFAAGAAAKCRCAYRDTATTQGEYYKCSYAKIGLRLVAPIGADWDQD